MSKSKGTFIRASTYLKYLDPSYLRYYFASKLGNALDDIDLSFDDFINKINSDLVGKVVNLASRTARFVEQTGLSAAYPGDEGLFEQAAKDGAAIAEAYDTCDYNRAMRIVMAAADRANKYIDEQKPWTLAKETAKEAADNPENRKLLQDVCTVGLNLFRQLAIYLAPVLPKLAQQTGELLGDPIVSWQQSQSPLVGKPVRKFEHLLQRVDPKQVAAMVAASTESAPGEKPSEAAEESGPATIPFDTDAPLLAEPMAEQITFDDFAKVDLRVARVVEAEDVEGAKKLLKLSLSLGGEHRRTVFAGIKEAYQPADLVGRLVICAANLAPRKMKFSVSEGMIVATGPGGSEVYLLSPDSGAKPGQRVH
jgi:methionyl-tRNA synthetase